MALMPEVVDLTGDEERPQDAGVVAPVAPVVVDLTVDEPQPRVRRRVRPASEDGRDPEPRVRQRVRDECDPTVMRDGAYPRILVRRCWFKTKKGREETALVYLLYTECCGVGVFAGEDIAKDQAVFLYGGELIHVEPCSRSKMAVDKGTHIMTLPGRLGINSAVKPPERPWSYYVEDTRQVAGFANASKDHANCAREIFPDTTSPTTSSTAPTASPCRRRPQ
jgi:hypothetical protein